MQNARPNSRLAHTSPHATKPRNRRTPIVSTFATSLLAVLTLGPTSTASPPLADDQHAASPPPSVFQIGNAVAPINYWMTAWTLNDLFKITGFESDIGDTRPSRAWVPVIDGQWLIDRRHDVPTDDLGWPTSLKLTTGQRADSLNTIVIAGDHAGAFPQGQYRLRFDGEGHLRIDGAANIQTTDLGLDFQYDGDSPLILSITDTDPHETGNYLRNIEVLRPDAVQGERFNNKYIEALKPLAVIRPLHLLGE